MRKKIKSREDAFRVAREKKAGRVDDREKNARLKQKAVRTRKGEMGTPHLEKEMTSERR